MFFPWRSRIVRELTDKSVSPGPDFLKQSFWMPGGPRYIKGSGPRAIEALRSLVGDYEEVLSLRQLIERLAALGHEYTENQIGPWNRDVGGPNGKREWEAIFAKTGIPVEYMKEGAGEGPKDLRRFRAENPDGITVDIFEQRLSGRHPSTGKRTILRKVQCLPRIGGPLHGLRSISNELPPLALNDDVIFQERTPENGHIVYARRGTEDLIAAFRRRGKKETLYEGLGPKISPIDAQGWEIVGVAVEFVRGDPDGAHERKIDPRGFKIETFK